MRLVVVLAVVLSVSTAADFESEHGSRQKRQDDRWIWGPFNDAPVVRAQSEQITATEAPAPAKSNPCDPFNPVKPDFRAPGRRKSDVKCFEYIWEMKRRNDQQESHKKCQEYLVESGKLPFFKHLVIGGKETLPGEYPHMGAIGWKASIGTWIFKCGGSLISEKFILTAGHCSKASSRDTSIADVDPKIVRLGDKNILDISYNNLGPRDYNISRVIVHPLYKPPKKYNDIALIELATPVDFDKFTQPACLWGRPDLQGINSAFVTGWGVVETAGKTTSPELQAASVDLVDSQQCDSLLRPSCNRHWCGIQNHQICAGKLTGGVDACQGDSGGPLQLKVSLPINDQGSMNQVIGVTSFGIGCGLPNLPGIYTKVSSFIDWIENIVWP
ncbi:serine protease snake-like isoform X1 [Ostrinia furnacalis]|uniref:serine protease snake-like isoform X1 n=1 Tax=Ostrinia furnacalis TaxID=93504 RepID=UPI00103B2F0F|nr:serine protease snake-like isoform X1 [Ostrinia furnacalis]